MTHQNKEFADSPFQVTLRFGTFLLACVLWMFQFRHGLPQAVASVCQLFSLCGMAFYFSLELVASQRALQAVKPNFNLGDRRLSFRIRAETKMASLVERERSSL